MRTILSPDPNGVKHFFTIQNNGFRIKTVINPKYSFKSEYFEPQKNRVREPEKGQKQ